MSEALGDKQYYCVGWISGFYTSFWALGASRAVLKNYISLFEISQSSTSFGQVNQSNMQFLVNQSSKYDIWSSTCLLGALPPVAGFI
jgi:hypothetical protein